jgi:Zn-dependent protease with chaperone function
LSRILRTEEFIGIIGHELGHFKGEDTKFSQQFFPIYRGTVNSIAALQHSGGQGSGVIALLPAIALFSYFLECFSVAESKISRDRELIADRAGVEVSSVHAMATALVKVHAFAGIWEQVQNGAASLLSQGKGWLNASKTFAGAVVRAARPEALENVATTEMPHPTDSHPPLSVRLQALGLPLASLVQDALVVEPADAAINLVDEPEKIEQEVNDTYHSILRKYLPGQVEQGQPEATS